MDFGKKEQNQLAWSGLFVVAVLALMWWFQGLELSGWASWEMSTWGMLAAGAAAGWLVSSQSDLLPALVSEERAFERMGDEVAEE